jgi:predicted permease
MWTRFRFFFRRKRRADLDEELQFHLEHLVAENIAKGMPDEEARRNARLEFGSLEATRGECEQERPSHWIETALHDLRIALRGFRRNPTFAIAVVLTFTIAIGATSAIFSAVDRILFRPLPYTHADRLVSVGLLAPIMAQEFMLGGSYYTWRDEQKPFASFTSETGAQPCDLTEEHPVRLSCAAAEANFLPTLGVSPILGRNFTPEEDRPNAPRVALISNALWRERFHSSHDVLEKVLSVDGRPLRVIGVLPPDFEMPALEPTDLLLPQALDEAQQRKAQPGRVMYAFARLKPGMTIEQSRKELQPVFDFSLNLAPPQFRKEVHLRVRSLRDRQMHDVRIVAWVLLGIALTVLLIACANVSSLLMARTAAREREFAVRAALGASRVRLAQQAVIEALVLAAGGAVGGILLAFVLLRSFVVLAPQGMLFLAKAGVDSRVLAFTIVVAVVCGTACGFFAALHRPRAEALAGRNAMAAPHARLRQILVIAQIAASVTLLCAGALLSRSFWNLERQRLGIDPERIVTATISLGQKNYPKPEDVQQFYEQLEKLLRYGPGVDVFATADSLPPGGYHHEHIYAAIAVNGLRNPGGTGGLVAWRWVTPDYFRLLNIPIVQGAGFTDEQRDSNDHFLVLSQRLAHRMFPTQDPVGQHLQLAGGDPEDPQYTIVGVAADVKNGGLAGEDEPEYYRLRRNRAEDWQDDATLVLKSKLPIESLSNFVRTQVSSLDPTVPVELQTLSQHVRKLADQPRFETMLVALFAATGLLLSMVGLYGVISFLTARRTQEIGLRMAMGATRGDVLRLVLNSGMRLIVPGALLGVLLALALSRLLSSLLFHIAPRDPASLAGAALLLLFIAIVAAVVPAASAARMDPMVALRWE